LRAHRRRGCRIKFGTHLGREPQILTEVVVLLMDSEHAFEEQDLRIAALVEREGRALVIGISKWDLHTRKAGGIGKLHEDADER
jgi:predicted GTPase